MFILPIVDDEIVTNEGVLLPVISIARHKTEAAVYVASGDDTAVIYFKDIEQVDGVNVKLVSGQNVFKASGKVKRRAQLPQPGDNLVVYGDQDELTVVLKSYVFNTPSSGFSSGLLLKDKSGNTWNLNQLKEFSEPGSSPGTDMNKFAKVYEDYYPKKGKKHVN